MTGDVTPDGIRRWFLQTCGFGWRGPARETCTYGPVEVPKGAMVTITKTDMLQGHATGCSIGRMDGIHACDCGAMDRMWRREDASLAPSHQPGCPVPKGGLLACTCLKKSECAPPATPIGRPLSPSIDEFLAQVQAAEAAKPRRDRNVLDEAKKLVHGDRNASYGNPSDDFGRAASMLNGLYRDKLKPGESFSPVDIARILIVVKLSRSMHSKKRDTWVDVAGYAETADWCEEDSVDPKEREGK
jgi:hypothetical protein